MALNLLSSWSVREPCASETKMNFFPQFFKLSRYKIIPEFFYTKRGTFLINFKFLASFQAKLSQILKTKGQQCFKFNNYFVIVDKKIQKHFDLNKTKHFTKDL